MIKYLFFICGLMMYGVGFAQGKSYVFIQSDNQQPFFVSINGKTYGSNLNGYLIIPQLTTGNYPCKIGFPQNKYPEQQFSLQVNNSDKGYELKNFAAKGWGLYDIIQYTIQMAEKQSIGIDAGAANPFALNDKPVIKEEPVKTQPIAVIAPAAPIKEEKVNIPVSVPKKQSLISKTYEKQGARGIDMVFIDASAIKADTIILFVPINESPVAHAGKVYKASYQMLSSQRHPLWASVRKEQAII